MDFKKPNVGDKVMYFPSTTSEKQITGKAAQVAGFVVGGNLDDSKVDIVVITKVAPYTHLVKDVCHKTERPTHEATTEEGKAGDVKTWPHYITLDEQK